MGNRQRGDYFERQTRAALEARGYFLIRAAGSHGTADLVALKRDATPLLVSCKLHGAIPRPDRQRLLDVAHDAGARGVVARRDRPGHVTLLVPLSATLRLVEIETLKVPTRALRGDDPARVDAT